MWQLEDSQTYPISLLCEIPVLHGEVIAGLDLSNGRVLSRDSRGSAVIWDLEEAVQGKCREEDLVIRKVEVGRTTQVTRWPAALALSERQWALSVTDISRPHCPMLVSDVWRTASQI